MTLPDPPELNTELLDANPILRYLLADQPDQFARSQALIESERQFDISVVTLIEVGYVLTKVAGVSTTDAVDAMIDLLERQNIGVYEVHSDLAIEALRLCAPSGRVNFGDAMLWATARASSACVWTFDQRFPESGIRVRRP